MGKKAKNTLPPFVDNFLKSIGVNNTKNKHLVNAVLAVLISAGGLGAFVHYR
jgi:hypothetical protein